MHSTDNPRMSIHSEKRGMSKREGQLSVPLDIALQEFVEREAQREDRAEAVQVRHLLRRPRDRPGRSRKDGRLVADSIRRSFSREAGDE